MESGTKEYRRCAGVNAPEGGGGGTAPQANGPATRGLGQERVLEAASSPNENKQFESNLNQIVTAQQSKVVDLITEYGAQLLHTQQLRCPQEGG